VVERRLRQQKGGVDVGFHRRVEILIGDVSDVGLRLLTCGVVDQDVEAAERGHRILDELFAEILVP
jgi:hypothetical protein